MSQLPYRQVASVQYGELQLMGEGPFFSFLFQTKKRQYHQEQQSLMLHQMDLIELQYFEYCVEIVQSKKAQMLPLKQTKEIFLNQELFSHLVLEANLLGG